MDYRTKFRAIFVRLFFLVPKSNNAKTRLSLTKCLIDSQRFSSGWRHPCGLFRSSFVFFSSSSLALRFACISTGQPWPTAVSHRAAIFFSLSASFLFCVFFSFSSADFAFEASSSPSASPFCFGTSRHFVCCISVRNRLQSQNKRKMMKMITSENRKKTKISTDFLVFFSVERGGRRDTRTGKKERRRRRKKI